MNQRGRVTAKRSQPPVGWQAPPRHGALRDPLHNRHVWRRLRSDACPIIDDSDSSNFRAAEILTPIRPLKPEEIKAIREREHVSQTVLANYLNVTSSLVSKWERGEKRPSGASLKLLSLVEKNGLAAVA